MKKFIAFYVATILTLSVIVGQRSSDAATAQWPPAGTTIIWNGYQCPAGTLAEDGSQVSRSTYRALFLAIGTIHGIGNGTTTFNLPDKRGRVMRVYDGAAGLDPDSASRVAAVASTWVGSGNTSNGSATITVSSTVGYAPGMSISGTGIPAGSYIRAILSSTTFKLGNAANSADVNATATGTGVTLTLSKAALANYPGSVQADMYASHNHVQDAHSHSFGVYGNSPAITAQVATSADGYKGATGTSAAQPYIYPAGGNETRMKNVTVLSCIKI